MFISQDITNCPSLSIYTPLFFLISNIGVPKEAFIHVDFVGTDRRVFCRDGKVHKCTKKSAQAINFDHTNFLSLARRRVRKGSVRFFRVFGPNFSQRSKGTAN